MRARATIVGALAAVLLVATAVPALADPARPSNFTSRITDVYTKQGRRGGEMTFAVMVTDFVDSTGTLVARATMTGVETARPATEA